MIKYYYKNAKEEGFTLLHEPKEGCWIHVDEANVEDLMYIGSLIGLGFLELQDALDKYEIPRIEKIQQKTLIFFRYPNDQEPGLYTSPITVVLAGHYFITISPIGSPLITHFLEKKMHGSTLQRSKLLIALFFKAVHEFTAEVRKVRHTVLRQEKEMITVDSDDISALTNSEEVLNQYFAALAPFRSVLEAMISGKYNNFYEKDHEQIDDLLNAVKQSEELCSIVLKSIRSLRDSYQIIFTNNLHKTIKLLTSLTILFSIPTMIASVYGMNIELPLAHRAFAFTWIMLMILGLSALGLWFFKRKRWL